MERLKNFGDRANTAGFDKHPENLNDQGRPLSIKSDLKRILGANGEMTIKAANIVNVHDNGDVTVRMAQSETLALRLLDWANSSRGADSLKALQMIINHTDGKADQKIEITAPPIITGMTIE